MTTRKDLSQLSAERIRRAVLDRLQNADEIGGPDGVEYVALMRELATTCTALADMCEEVHGAYIFADSVGVLRAGLPAPTVAQTGGAFTALEFRFSDSLYAWITCEKEAPRAVTDTDADLGIYLCEDGSQFVCFHYPTVADALTALTCLTAMQNTEEHFNANI